MMKKLLLIPFLLILGSCNKNEETTTVTKYVGCTKTLENQGSCLRWMDRKIHLAYSNAASPQRNNEFQKQKVQEAFAEIEEMSSLGKGYFQFTEVDEALLPPIVESGLSVDEYKSFILIWPDDVFNDYVVNQLGGTVPDANAVTVINSAYKRKFFMILRANCFSSNANCNNITTNGIKALIARQMGMLIGIRPSTTCATLPEDTMCTALPNDAQWSDTSKLKWKSAFDNNLETILNNTNYYDEYIPPQ